MARGGLEEASWRGLPTAGLGEQWVPLNWSLPSLSNRRSASCLHGFARFLPTASQSWCQLLSLSAVGSRSGHRVAWGSTAPSSVAEASSAPRTGRNLSVQPLRTRVSCPAVGYRVARVSVFRSLGSHGHSTRDLRRSPRWLGGGGSVTHTCFPGTGLPPMTSGRTHVTGEAVEAGGRWGQGDRPGGVPTCHPPCVPVLVDSPEGRGKLSAVQSAPGE